MQIYTDKLLVSDLYYIGPNLYKYNVDISYIFLNNNKAILSIGKPLWQYLVCQGVDRHRNGFKAHKWFINSGGSWVDFPEHSFIYQANLIAVNWINAKLDFLFGRHTN